MAWIITIAAVLLVIGFVYWIGMDDDDDWYGW